MEKVSTLNLQMALQEERYEEALNLLDQIPDIPRLRANILIKQGEVVKALKILQSINQIQSFECAYCYYRLGKLEKARSIISILSRDDERTDYLLAQVLYRQGQYAEAKAIYHRLLKGNKGDEQLITNYTACCAALAHSSSSSSSSLSQELDGNLGNLVSLKSSYEILYNRACELISCPTDWDDAKLLLKAALEKCRQSFNNDENDHDFVQESALIRAQLALIDGMKGIEKGKNENLHVQSVSLINSAKSSKQLTKGLKGLTAFQKKLALQKAILMTYKQNQFGTCYSMLKRATKSNISVDQPFHVLALMAASKCSKLRPKLSKDIREKMLKYRQLEHFCTTSTITTAKHVKPSKAIMALNDVVLSSPLP